MCFVGRGYFAAVYLADWLNMTGALLLGKGGLLLRKALRTRDSLYKPPPTISLRSSAILPVLLSMESVAKVRRYGVSATAVNSQMLKQS